MLSRTRCVGLITFFFAASAGAETLTVGPGKMFPAPCAAIAAAHDGDLIEIDAAGTYGGDAGGGTQNSPTPSGGGGRGQNRGPAQKQPGKGAWGIKRQRTPRPQK